MGCGGSVPVLSTNAQTEDVDRQLREAKEREENHFKILLLGAGESGKSTVVKQVKLIHKGGVSPGEKADYVNAIRQNCVECMQTLLEGMLNLGLDVEGGDEVIAAKERVMNPADGEEKLTPAMADDIAALWNDSGVKAAYDQRDSFWLLDACCYYFDECLRLAEEDFDPTEEDMIMTRVRTTGIVVTEFTDGPQNYSLVDVGGQRSERRKWIHCFDDSKAIIFLVGLSGYHQVLFEDSKVIRMHESLELFDQVVNNPIFRDTPIFVFLNKKDLFEQLIVKTPLKTCFPEYDGPEGESRPALEFIQSKYEAVMAKRVPGKQVYVQIIAARVRMDMKVAFGEVKDQIKKHYLKNKA